MATRVDFYILQNQKATAIFPFTCRIAEKAYKQNHEFFIHCATEQDMQQLDNLLWTFNDISFIPHAISTNQTTAHHQKVPVLLGTQPAAKPEKQLMLINLTHHIPEDIESWQRVIEIVPEEDPWRQVSRQKFTKYREVGCELNTHKMNQTSYR